jgi:hypothetical protein
MPWINGRFYANPLFGRALERARVSAAGRVWSEERPELERQESSQARTTEAAPMPVSQHPQAAQPDHQKAIEKKASVGYGETRGLLPQKSSSAKTHSPYDRTTWDKDSFDELQEARRNIMDVSERNPRVHRAKPSEKADAIERSVWGDNRSAAAQSGGALPGKHFFVR